MKSKEPGNFRGPSDPIELRVTWSNFGQRKSGRKRATDRGLAKIIGVVGVVGIAGRVPLALAAFVRSGQHEDLGVE